MRKQEVHVVWGERRRQHASLSAPLGTLGEKNALAKQGAEDSRHHRRAHIVGCVCCQHMPDTFRIVDEDGIYAEEPSAGEWNVERVVRKDRDAVALSCQQVTPSRKVSGMDLRCWRNYRYGLGEHI